MTNLRQRSKSVTEMLRPKPAVVVIDPSRVRLVSLPYNKLAWLLQLDGTRRVKVDGWPAGARIIGTRLNGEPYDRIEFLLYHPEFAPCLNPNDPPHLQINARSLPD